jgi:hypothetical protein
MPALPYFPLPDDDPLAGSSGRPLARYSKSSRKAPGSRIEAGLIWKFG